MEAWLQFITTCIWQLLVTAILVGLYRSGIFQKISELSLSPGGLVLKVQEIQERQVKIQRDVDALRFLVSGFVTKWELEHLLKLLRNEAFDYHWSGTADDRFIRELKRLTDLGLIAKQKITSWYEIPRAGNLQEYAAITPRGREHIQLLQQMQSDENRES